MIAVIFEVVPAPGRMDLYLDTARDLRLLLESIDGFISIERFRSLTDPTRLLSLSFWRDEAAVKADMKDGVPTVIVPKKAMAEAKSTRIPINKA